MSAGGTEPEKKFILLAITVIALSNFNDFTAGTHGEDPGTARIRSFTSVWYHIKVALK